MSTLADLNRLASPLRMSELRQIVLAADPDVTELLAELLTHTRSHLFDQAGEFKYGLSVTVEGYVVHSPLFLHHPELQELATALAPGVRWEDGTVLFPFEAVDGAHVEDVLRALISAAALKPFPLP